VRRTVGMRLSGIAMSKRLLKDTEGRELRLAPGSTVDGDVLLVEGEPLIVIDDPDRLTPEMMDSIADSLPGSRWTAGGD